MPRHPFLGILAALRRERLSTAVRLIEEACFSAEVSTATLFVKQGNQEFARGFGRALGADYVFLLASITKPMTATGVMILRDRGELSLNDPVRKYIPEFSGGDRDLVTIKHILTHTSGLGDMPPENEQLRKRHAPLSDFVAATCRMPLLFKPGTQVKYQSMGILLAAEIAERITKQPFRDFLRKELFTPLGMHHTSLGLGGRQIPDLAICQVDRETNWDWNSPYWRDFGAPWGGAHSSGPEVARFLDFFQRPDPPVIKPQTAAEMIVDQNMGLNEPRGIGFMVKPGAFGKACSPKTYGHSGSTGTICWADPVSNTICVLLTTKPAAQSRAKLLIPVCDAVSEAALPA
ncbi:MAG: beta-lactamase family protein [Bryobacterales bacterium]|nr:beta-lactamase family protein [Bryobacterales bacterium]